MEIRRLKKNDIGNALNLVWNVFQEFDAPEYPEEGIKEFKDFINHGSMIEKVNNGEMSFWGCFDDDKLTGVIATRDVSHISLLFVDKKYHRKGIARGLVNEVKNVCESNEGCKDLTVNSSLYGKEFYHSVGFIDMDKEQMSHGIRYIPMICKIK